MTPLMLRIVAGLEDARLLSIIETLREIHAQWGLSAAEYHLFDAAWNRLEAITS